MVRGEALSHRARSSVLISAAPPALVSLASAWCFAQVGTKLPLSQDEAIYAYGGEQLLKGVPFYVSIFDAKGPLAATLGGAGAAAAGIVGADMLSGIRIMFFVLSVCTTVCVFLAAQALFRSSIAGFLSAFAFTGFKGFGIDALGGPNAKTPAIMFGVLCIYLVVCRSWFWAALVASLASLVWQPMAVFSASALLLAFLADEGETTIWQRGRSSLLGAALPLVAVLAYYALEGAVGDLLDGLFVFNLSYLDRAESGLAHSLGRMGGTLMRGYSPMTIPIVVGLVAVLLMIAYVVFTRRRNLVSFLRRNRFAIVPLTLLPAIGWSLLDFQGYADWYPLLPFAAMGLGGLGSALIRLVPRASLQTVITVALSLVLLTAAATTYAAESRRGLTLQLAEAIAIDRRLGDRNLFVIGNPSLLALTGRQNPSRYIYLNSGLELWAVDHIPDGTEGYLRAITNAQPGALVVSKRCPGPLVTAARRWARENGFIQVDLGGIAELYAAPDLAPDFASDFPVRGLDHSPSNRVEVCDD